MWWSIAWANPMVAVVVVDREARDQGYAIQIDGWLVEDALPVSVAQGEVLQLVDPDGRPETMQVEPGEAWEVTGPEGETWMALLDDEIRSDLLVVSGPRTAIDSLARDLGATVFEEDGKIFLSGENILLESGWVHDEKALRVEQVSFVKVRAKVAERPQVPLAARSSATVLEPATRTEVPPASAPSTAEGPAAQAEPASEPSRTKRARREQKVTEDFPSDAELAAYQRFAGIHVCNNELLGLRRDGTYQFRGEAGSWSMIGNRVARLHGANGAVLWRAGFNADRHCVAVWAAPLED